MRAYSIDAIVTTAFLNSSTEIVPKLGGDPRVATTGALAAWWPMMMSSNTFVDVKSQERAVRLNAWGSNRREPRRYNRFTRWVEKTRKMKTPLSTDLVEAGSS